MNEIKTLDEALDCLEDISREIHDLVERARELKGDKKKT
jgi:hypothetical protein